MNIAEYKTAFRAIEREMIAGHMGIPSGLARIAQLSFELERGEAPTPRREDFLSHAVITAAVAKVKTFDAPELIGLWTKVDRDLYLAVMSYLSGGGVAMTADLVIRAVLDLEPGEKAQINGLAVQRWPQGAGWTVGEPGRSAGSSSLPTIVRILQRGQS